MCKYIFSDHTDHGKQNNFGKELFHLYLEYLCATFLPVFTYTVHVGHLSALLLVLVNNYSLEGFGGCLNFWGNLDIQD